MKYYFISDIKIHNQKQYNLYLTVIDKVFSRYKGKYPAVDNHPEVIEGDWNSDRLVIVSFDSRTDFEDFYYSKDYQEILKHRLNSVYCTNLLVKGKDEKNNSFIEDSD